MIDIVMYAHYIHRNVHTCTHTIFSVDFFASLLPLSCLALLKTSSLTVCPSSDTYIHTYVHVCIRMYMCAYVCTCTHLLTQRKEEQTLYIHTYIRGKQWCSECIESGEAKTYRLLSFLQLLLLFRLSVFNATAEH